MAEVNKSMCDESRETSVLEKGKISKGHDNSGIHNSVIMSFFDELLSFASIVRAVYHATGNRYVQIDANNECTQLDLLEEHLAEKLLSFFFSLCQSNEKLLVYISAAYLLKDDRNTLRYKKESGVVFRISDNSERDRHVILQINESLETSFLEEELKTKLLIKLQELSDLYVKKCEFWNKKETFLFLNKYFEILQLCICEEDILNTGEIVTNLLIPVLNLGIDWNDGGESGTISMMEPVVLSAFNLVYDRLGEYVCKPVESDLEESICKEIFLAKIHQIFRFYVINDTTLYHVAIPAYVPFTDDNQALSIAVRPMTVYNSYQGIRELRIADKILFELSFLHDDAKQLYCSKDTFYHIVILGEINYEPMYELVEYVNTAISIKDEYQDIRQIHLAYHIFTNMPPETSYQMTSSEYKVVFEKYDNQLLDMQKLQKILMTNQLFFFLDNCHLYKTDVQELDDHIMFKQSISFETYQQYYNKNTTDDLKLDCKFMDLYNALVTFCYSGKLGTLKKKAREDIIKYIRNIINKSDSKQAYIYISNIEAFKELTCVQEHIVRIEKYNQKEIGIIRFTSHNFPKVELPVVFGQDEIKDRKNILVFNIWQFVKHVMINKRVQFAENFIVKKDKHLLDEIYIGLDYTNWKEQIVVSYWFHDRSDFYETSIKKFMIDMLNIVFASNCLDMYQRYLRKTFISYLYGAAKSVEDLIFLHILKRKIDTVGALEFYREDYNPQLETYYNMNCKYSYKKMYWEAIEEFDRSILNYIHRYTILNAVKTAKSNRYEENETDASAEFLADITSACENIGYQDSTLYQNCLETYKI